MRKILLFIVAIVSLNMIMPQKASAQEELNDVVVGDITYYLLDYGNDLWQVEAVSPRALDEHHNITSLDLPSGISSVNDNSFSESETLNSLIIRAEVPPVVYDKGWQEVSDTDIFNSQRIVKVYVPEGSVQAYKDDSNWGKRPIFPISQYQAIEQITNDELRMTNKVLRDGILLIERNGKTYNAQGVEVK